MLSNYQKLICQLFSPLSETTNYTNTTLCVLIILRTKRPGNPHAKATLVPMCTSWLATLPSLVHDCQDGHPLHYMYGQLQLNPVPPVTCWILHMHAVAVVDGGSANRIVKIKVCILQLYSFNIPQHIQLHHESHDVMNGYSWKRGVG